MKKLIMVVLLLMVMVTIVKAEEISIGYKQGYTYYDESSPSYYEGNDVYDNEMTNWGAFIRVVEDKHIVRLDIDKLETGNTFQNSLGIAYERVDIDMMPIVLNYGQYLWKDAYGLIGIGYSINDILVEGYVPYPFHYKMFNSLIYTVTLGYDYNLNDNWYVFLEGRYMYNKARVALSTGRRFKEDLGNKTGFIGLGYRF